MLPRVTSGANYPRWSSSINHYAHHRCSIRNACKQYESRPMVHHRSDLRFYRRFCDELGDCLSHYLLRDTAYSDKSCCDEHGAVRKLGMSADLTTFTCSLSSRPSNVDRQLDHCIFHSAVPCTLKLRAVFLIWLLLHDNSTRLCGIPTRDEGPEFRHAG